MALFFGWDDVLADNILLAHHLNSSASDEMSRGDVLFDWPAVFDLLVGKSRLDPLVLSISPSDHPVEAGLPGREEGDGVDLGSASTKGFVGHSIDDLALGVNLDLS